MERIQGRRKHLLLFTIGLVLIPGCALGCQFFLGQEEAVTFQLPRFPRTWLGQDQPDSFELFYVKDGREASRLIPHGSGTVELSVSLGKRTPIVLYPLVRKEFGSIRLYPAGGLYPDFFRSGDLEIRWEDGFAAETLLLAARRGFPLDTFNCSRFFEEARKRGGSNPWDLNRSRVLETLASGSFRADRFVPRQKFSLSLPLSSGEWYAENLLEPPFTVGVEGTVLLQGLAWGFHRYWSTDRSFTLRVSENGRVETAEYRTDP